MSDGDRMDAQDLMDDTERCTATASSTGERCKNPAIPGGNVCNVHGGEAPQVKRKASERLNEMARRVLEESEPHLFDLIESYSDAETLDEKAAVLREIRQWTTSILDRAPNAPNKTEDRNVDGDVTLSDATIDFTDTDT